MSKESKETNSYFIVFLLCAISFLINAFIFLDKIWKR